MLSEFRWTAIAQERGKILREYEPVQPYFFFEFVNWFGARVFYDVGANIGSYSLLMSKIESLEEIHAFEPTPTTFAQLVANVDLNRLNSRIQCHQIAVSSQSGSMQLGIVNDFSGANGLVDTHIHASGMCTSVIDVQVERLDALVNDPNDWPGQALAMKIDVEGHEREVLAGAEELVGAHDVLLQIEDYGDAGVLHSQLSLLGFTQVWRIGADRYYVRGTKCPSNAELLTLIDAAHDRMIADFRALSARDSSRPGAPSITRRVFGDVSTYQ